MARCEVCGNDYHMAFQVITAGVTHTFDCFECAAHKLAPICDHCGCKILGHGIEAQGTFFCSAHCARTKGATEIVDNAEHARPSARQTADVGGLRAAGAPAESWRGSGLAEDVGGTARRAGAEPDEVERG